MPWLGWVVILLINALLVFVGYLSVRKMLKGSACEALRPYVPTKIKNLKISKPSNTNGFRRRKKANLRE